MKYIIIQTSIKHSSTPIKPILRVIKPIISITRPEKSSIIKVIIDVDCSPFIIIDVSWKINLHITDNNINNIPEIIPIK